MEDELTSHFVLRTVDRKTPRVGYNGRTAHIMTWCVLVHTVYLRLCPFICGVHESVFFVQHIYNLKDFSGVKIIIAAVPIFAVCLLSLF